MLVAHQIVDALRQKRGRMWDKTYALCSQQECGRIAGLIEQSQKFDFGPLMLEREAGTANFIIPKLTPTEWRFFKQGLIPQPFPLCWYEFVIGSSRSGLLIQEDAEGITMTRLDWVENRVLADGILLVLKRGDINPDDVRNIETSMYSKNPAADQLLAKIIEGNPRHRVEGLAPLAVYLTLMLNSQSTEREHAPAAKFINRKRAAKGLSPLSEHTIVHIVPYRYQREQVVGSVGAVVDRRAPRLHWRRSHLRHYERRVPSATWSEDIEHEGKKGWWVAVIPRCLVGHADLGEISHEYFVESDPGENTTHRPPSPPPPPQRFPRKGERG